MKATFPNLTTTAYGLGDTCVYTVAGLNRLAGKATLNSLTSLTLAPNPTADASTLHMPHGVKVARLEVIDAQGRVVQTLTNFSNAQSGNATNAMSSLTFGQTLAAGIYRVVAHTEDGQILSASWIKNGR